MSENWSEAINVGKNRARIIRKEKMSPQTMIAKSISASLLKIKRTVKPGDIVEIIWIDVNMDDEVPIDLVRRNKPSLLPTRNYGEVIRVDDKDIVISSELVTDECSESSVVTTFPIEIIRQINVLRKGTK